MSHLIFFVSGRGAGGGASGERPGRARQPAWRASVVNVQTWCNRYFIRGRTFIPSSTVYRFTDLQFVFPPPLSLSLLRSCSLGPRHSHQAADTHTHRGTLYTSPCYHRAHRRARLHRPLEDGRQRLGEGIEVVLVVALLLVRAGPQQMEAEPLAYPRTSLLPYDLTTSPAYSD